MLCGWPLYYHRLDDTGLVAALDSLGAKLRADLMTLADERVVMTTPGDWRVFKQLKAVVEAAGLTLEICEDRHFFSRVSDFATHAKGRKSLRLKYFYRKLRQRHNILMDDGQPAAGKWNFDTDNRETFGAKRPGVLPPRAAFKPDSLTREVITLVKTRYAAPPPPEHSKASPGRSTVGRPENVPCAARPCPSDRS